MNDVTGIGNAIIVMCGLYLVGGGFGCLVAMSGRQRRILNGSVLLVAVTASIASLFAAAAKDVPFTLPVDRPLIVLLSLLLSLTGTALWAAPIFKLVDGINDSSVGLSRYLFLCGSLLTLCVVSLPILLMAALTCCLFAGTFCEFASGRLQRSVDKRQAIIVLSGLWGGYLLGELSSYEPIRKTSVLLIVVGLFASLEWMSIKRDAASNEDSSIANLLSRTILPVLAASVFLFRFSLLSQWTTSEASLLAAISICCLGLWGLRLQSQIDSTSRGRILTNVIFGQANLATVLSVWSARNPRLSWEESSNLTSPDSLFCLILVIESLAAFVYVWSSFDRSHCEEDENERPSQSKIWEMAATLSLCGVPPLPGAWWRLMLFNALLLPHQRSVLTHLTEPHRGFIALAIVTLLVNLLLATGGIRQAQLMSAESHESARSMLGKYLWLAVGCGLGLYVTLAIGQFALMPA
ncbi:hypothetical protein AB1L42_03285 [Thalassoglobus sp. JC818]|uniref:hypothetical protein n=1 Tax=Thalassoglobus sp. JC818 TaxID=3232136 RepID=UPI0034577EF2